MGLWGLPIRVDAARPITRNGRQQVEKKRIIWSESIVIGRQSRDLEQALDGRMTIMWTDPSTFVALAPAPAALARDGVVAAVTARGRCTARPHFSQRPARITVVAP